MNPSRWNLRCARTSCEGVPPKGPRGKCKNDDGSSGEAALEERSIVNQPQIKQPGKNVRDSECKRKCDEGLEFVDIAKRVEDVIEQGLVLGRRWVSKESPETAANIFPEARGTIETFETEIEGLPIEVAVSKVSVEDPALVVLRAVRR